MATSRLHMHLEECNLTRIDHERLLSRLVSVGCCLQDVFSREKHPPELASLAQSKTEVSPFDLELSICDGHTRWIQQKSSDASVDFTEVRNESLLVLLPELRQLSARREFAAR